jgi:transposase-like protein
MGKHSFTRELKLEAVRLMRERGVTISQASSDLGLGADLRLSPPTWSLQYRSDPQISQDRAAHNGATQPRQALRTPGQR